MLAAEIGTAALGLFFHLHARPAIVADFHDDGIRLPATAALALSAWFLPAALGFGGICSLVGMAAPLRRSRRAALVGVGLVVSASAVVFAVGAAFVSLFRPE
jgi:hypothetical protein